MKFKGQKSFGLFLGFLIFIFQCKSMEAQNPVDSSTLKIEKINLHVPSLKELQSVFSEALLENFEHVSVEIVDCPDLKEEPFTLAASGLGGKPTILDIGRPDIVIPTVRKSIVYDIKNLINFLNHSSEPFVIGAAAGPWPLLDIDCDSALNIVLNKPDSSASYVAHVDKKTGAVIFKRLPSEETRFSAVGNLLLSEGKTGKVLKVHVRKRTGGENFISSMRKGLENRYKRQLVGMGGTFVAKKGKILQHLLPDFFEYPIKFPNSNLQIQDNKFYLFNTSAPIIAVGTFVSAKTDLQLDVQHFHTFSHHGEGGHYRTDTTPEIVEYLGYFTPGEILYRIDRLPKI